jgi:hypothetical protein
MGLAARWPDLPESPNLDASELAAVSNSYADTQITADAEEQMPLTWPVTEPGRASQAAFGSVFLAGALALGSLSLVGGVFNLARRSRQRYLRDPWRTAAGWSGPKPHMRADFSELAGSSSVGARHGASTLRVPQPSQRQYCQGFLAIFGKKLSNMHRLSNSMTFRAMGPSLARV